ncbi:MAG: tetratricopeptide repeat protein, partial [Tepidiformaceae bacterium]
PRPGLLNRLHESVGNGLTIVQAPAGFGKTTLLGAFAAEIAANYTVCWLSLDASCSVPEVMAAEFAMAVLGERSFIPPATVGRTGDLKAYLGGVLNEATESSALPLLVVFDNVHEAGDDEATVDLLGWLIESGPAGMEVVLSGRELPPLAGVDARVAGGEALMLGSTDLAFTEEEVQALAERSAYAGGPADLWGQTGGWPVAVMAICSRTIAQDAAPKRQQDAAWTRYLGSQVLAAVPEELRSALLRLSPLPVIDGWQASERIGRDAWMELAAWLSAHDFLYEALDDGRFRLNPMIRAFLCDEYQRTDPVAFDSALGGLIEALTSEGRFAEAIELGRRPGQEERLGDVLEGCAQGLLHKGAFALLERGFKSLPGAVIARRPLLAAVRARALVHLGRAYEGLEAADALLEDESFTGAPRIHATLAKMRAMRLFGQHVEVVEMTNRIRAIDDCGEDSAVLAELCYAEADIALSVSADFPRAERMLQETIRLCEAAGLRSLGLLAASTLGQTLTMRGNAPAAVEMLAKAAQGWRRIGRSANLGWVLNNLGMAYLQVGDFESALAVLAEARAEGERCENPRNAAYAIASMADAELALGHWQRSRELYENAIKICAEDAPDETLAALSISGLSGALLGLGDLQEADYFIQRALLVATVSSNSFEMATCKLQQAAVESASGNHATAISVAREAAELF